MKVQPSTPSNRRSYLATWARILLILAIALPQAFIGAVPVAHAAETCVTSSISQSSDDAMQGSSSNNMYLTDTTLYTQSTAARWWGLRFQGVTVPQGATITSASITFRSGTSTTATPTMNVYGEASDNASTFTTTASNISNRSRTASVAWAMTAWTSGSNYTSADLTTPVQAIVNRSGWSSGNAMAFLGLVTTNVNKIAVAWDDTNQGNQASLSICYNSTTPTITTSVSALSGFNAAVGQTSAEQSYNVAGTNLTNDIIITPPTDTDIEISTSSGSGFVSYPSTLTISKGSGTVAATPIYVHLKPTSAKTYTSLNIANASVDATTKNVAVSGSSFPTITITGTLAAFSAATGAYSGNQTYTVSAVNLTADLVITPPANFEVSISSTGGFVANPGTLTLTQSGGVVGSTSIYTRFKSDTAQTISGDITHDSSGATQKTVAVSGTAGDPTITTSGTLTVFSSTTGVASSAQSFTVSGSYLSGNVVVTAPSGFQVSTTSGSGFDSSVTLTPTGSTLVSTTIYVRMNRATAGSSSGSITVESSGATTQYVPASGTAFTWIAYNDCFVTGTPTNPANTNAIVCSTNAASGGLKNFDTGSSTGATVTVATSGTISTYAFGTPDTRTDAYNTFNGFANIYGNIKLGSSAAYIALTFTGLNPAKTYSFVTTAIRGDSSYTYRTIFNLSDVANTTVTNASTNGVTLGTTTIESDTSTFNTGYNTTLGYVARWTGIQPGSDGDFVVKYSTTDSQAYGPSVFMLAEENNTNPTITTNATLTDFNSAVGTPSAQQSYMVAGTNLTAPIVITPPTDFELSLTSGTGFSSSPISLSPSSGTVTSTPIYMRLNPTSATTYSANITHTSTGATQKDVAVSGSSVPTITASSAMTAFASAVGTPSAEQNYTVSGINLTDDIEITPPADFQISLTSGSGWVSNPNTISLTPSGGTVSDTTMYVRLNPTIATTYSASITHVSGGATTKNVAVTGSSVPTITATSSMTAFSSAAGVPSAEKSYTVSGVNLTGDIAILSPADFEISITSGGTFGSSLSLTPTGGVVGSTTIYVRFNRSTAGASSGDITHDSSGATQKTVAVSGTASDPTITTSGTLNAFSATSGVPSAEQTYTVSGSYLKGNITVTAPDDFEISTTSGSGFGSSLTLTPSGGTSASTTIYVRFHRATAGTASGSITHASTDATTQNVAVSGTTTDWTVSYNDCAWVAGQTSTNITLYTITSGSTTGKLKNYANGALTGVTATFTSSGSPGVQTGTTGGTETASGTDAYNTFHGFADMPGVIQYGSSGWYVVLTLSGLDPDKTYAFATSANRAGGTGGSPTYPNRISRFTISGVDAATNASTSGATVKTTNFTGDTTAFSTGENTSAGYVARWTGIQPGPDGTFVVRAEADTSVYQAYGFSVFLIGPEPNQAPVITESDPQAVTMSEDGSPTPFNLMLHATDANPGDTLTWSISGAASHGTATASGTGASKVIGYTPIENYNGSDSFVVQVSDGNGGTDTITVNVTIDPVNDAPELAAIGAKSVAEGSALAFTATASDADLPAQTLSFSLDDGSGGSVPAGATITAGGAFSWTPTEAQGGASYTFDVCVSDGTAADCETITVTVSETNVAPELAAIGAKSVAESSELSFTATATDVDLPAQLLTFSLVGAPTGAAIDGRTGAFTWTPTVAQVGEHTFTVKVCDDGSPVLCDEEEITVTVEWTLAHALTYVQNNTTLTGDLAALTATFPASIPAVIVAEDYTINSRMTLASALPAGSTVTIQITVNGAGPFPYVTAAPIPASPFWVTDLFDPAAAAANFDAGYGGRIELYSITINGGGGNPAAIDTTVKVESVISKDGFVTETVLAALDNIPVHVAADEAAALALVQDQTTLTGDLAALTATFPASIPAVIVAAPYTINSRMTLADPLPAGSTVTIQITVNGVGPFPYVTNAPIPASPFWVTDLFVPAAAAADFNAGYGGRIELYSITINGGGGNPAAIDTTVKIESIISKDNFATNTVLADITLPVHIDANAVPVITGQATLSTAEETTLTITLGDLTVTDADNTYPDDFSLAVLAGTNYTVVGATITPAADFNGVLTVPVKVNDGTVDSNTYNLSVTVTAVNDAPVVTGIPDQTIAEGASFVTISLDAYVSDVDNTDAEMTWTYTGNTALTVSIVNRVAMIGIPNADWNGAETITFKATDPGALWDDDAAVFTVTAENDAPVLGGIGDKSVDEGSLLTFTATASDVEVPPETLSFSLVDAPTGAAIAPDTGIFTWTPTVAQVGDHTFTVKVCDDGAPVLCDEEEITVTVTPVCYTLTTAVVGSGTISADPALNCNGTQYRHDTVVALTATANEGYTFAGWSGAATGTDNPVSVTMTGAKSVTADFTLNQYTLNVIKPGAGSGTVSSSPPGIDCGATCSAPYDYNTSVTLTAMPAIGSTFLGWAGSCSGMGSCVVIMSAARSVSATFAKIEYTLTVVSAHGTVTKSPNQTSYHYGDVVTLSAAADAGWTFVDWTPGLTDNQVTINGNTTVTANYSQNAYTLTVVSAHGTVTKSPDQASYHYGDVVTLSAAADAGWTFVGWTPALTANQVTIHGDTTVTANYADTTPPETSLDSYPSDPASSAAASFSFSSSEADSTFECQLDGGAFAACSSPKDYSGLNDGLHTFAVRATDAASNTDSSPASYTWTVDTTPLQVTALALRQSLDKATWASVTGDLLGGYTMPLDGAAESWYYLDVASLTANRGLADGYYGFTLGQTGLPANWSSYWTAKGVTSSAPTDSGEAWLYQIITGVKPIFYLEVGSGPSYRLVDGFLKDFAGITEYLRVNGDYPLGTYSYNGSVSDTMGGSAAVTAEMSFIGPDAPAAPAIIVSRSENKQDVLLTWPPVETDKNGKFTVVTKYQVFQSVLPYFTPNTDPDIGNLEKESADLDYLHPGAINNLTNYFYIVRAANIVGPSADSKQVGKFTFELVPGQ